MNKFIKRLFCFHSNWKEGRHPFSSYGGMDYYTNDFIPWTCNTCGKVKYFKLLNPPMQFISSNQDKDAGFR
jgi:hypothetical protein